MRPLSSLSFRRSLLALPLLLGCLAAAVPAGAQRADVVYEPTPHETVARMLLLGRVGNGDYLFDLGSGDGRLPIAAARNGARALGIEINPELVEKARANAAAAGVADRVTFRQEDLFQTPLSEATVITLYLLPELNERLRPRLLALRPGTRIISHRFPMGDWNADTIDDDGGRLYLWIVPARAEGRWHVRHGARQFTLEIEQRYQEISGTAALPDGAQALRDAELRGNEIQFTLDLDGRPTRFHGLLAGNEMQAAGGAIFSFQTRATGWSASRR